MVIPPRAVALGVPAKLRLDAVNEDIRAGAARYVANGAHYRAALRRLD